MLHYTNPGGESSDKTGYCKYCGRPLRNHASIIKGFGDVCFEKHKVKHVRRIKVGGAALGSAEGKKFSDRE